MRDAVILALLLSPLLVLTIFVMPPEWLFDIHDDSDIGRSVNMVLWLEMRLGEWEAQ